MYADSRGRAASAGDSRRGSLSGAAVQGNVIMALFGCRWQPVASALAGTVPATAMYFMARLFVAMHFVAMSAFGGQAFAQGALSSTHGDWEIRCDKPPGAQRDQCVLMQVVMAEDRPNTGLTVLVLKTADQKSRLLRVLAPLGVLLPSGLGLKIDDQDVGRAGFVRCLPNGCVAEVVMDDNLISKLRTGHTATFIIFDSPEAGIGFPLSLKGFGEGYDQLP